MSKFSLDKDMNIEVKATFIAKGQMHLLPASSINLGYLIKMFLEMIIWAKVA